MRRPNRTPIPRVAARKTGPTGRRYQARDATKIATTTINTIAPRTKMRRFVVRNWEPARATGGRAPGVRSILIDRAGRTPALTWSGRRDSNPRPPPWQGYRPRPERFCFLPSRPFPQVTSSGSDTPGRIRTA